MHCSNAHMSSSWDPVRPEDTAQNLFDSPYDLGKLGSRCDFDAKRQQGFDLWYERDQIREELARGGKGLLVALIQSHIARKGGTVVSISEEIAALGGDHLYLLVQDLIHEFEGTDPDCHLWHEAVPPGHYFLTI